MKKNAFDPVRARIWALTGLMGLCLLAFAGVMYYTQILHGEENRAKSLASNAASETVDGLPGDHHRPQRQGAGVQPADLYPDLLRQGF